MQPSFSSFPFLDVEESQGVLLKYRESLRFKASQETKAIIDTKYQ